MYFLNLDLDNYLLSISDTEMPNCPTLESLDEFDFSGVRMNASRWNGTTLVLDPVRLEELEKEQAAQEKEWKEIEKREEFDRVMKEAQEQLIAAQINTISVDDATALRWKVLYPEWSADSVHYSVGDKVQRNDRLYRCLQQNTSQANWAPELAASLWTEINEMHKGTIDDPIPYNNNMALENGKYYSQDGVTYLCTRDTGIPVYNNLIDLVGIYVSIA